MAVTLAHGSVDALSGAPVDTLIVPLGKRIKVDGVARAGEWADADTVQIQAGPDWVIPVLLKHDGEALYAAFMNLVRDRKERYPEVLLDIGAHRGTGWEENDWWLHVSHDDCTGRGFYGVYGHTCAQDAQGWYANNFPLPVHGTVEMKVSFDLVGLRPQRSKPAPCFGLGLAVAESESRSPNAANSDERRVFWPQGASMMPASWALVRLEVRP